MTSFCTCLGLSSFVVALALGGCAGPAAPRTPAQEEPAEHQRQHGHACGSAHHRFEDAASWSKVFDDPKRDDWQHPDEVVRELALDKHAVVADLGAGTGYFVMRLARAVPEGKVYAVDIEPGMVDYTKKRAQDAGLGNVDGILAHPDNPQLPTGVDVVLVVDTYHHIEDRSAYFRRVRERLAPGGRVVVVDFKKGDLPVGPPDAHKIAPELVAKEMLAAGYQQCRSWDGLPYQYVLFFADRC